jgi:hypothetical protein
MIKIQNWKLFLVTTLIYSLFWNLFSIPLSVSYATTPTPTPTLTPTAIASPAPSGLVFGVQTLDEQKDGGGVGDVSDKYRTILAFNGIGLIASTIVAVMFVSLCWGEVLTAMNVSIPVFVVGALLHAVTFITYMAKFTEFVKAQKNNEKIIIELNRLKDVTSEKEGEKYVKSQKELIQSALDEVKTLKEIVELKKNMMIAVTAIYGVAVVVGISEWIRYNIAMAVPVGDPPAVTAATNDKAAISVVCGNKFKAAQAATVTTALNLSPPIENKSFQLIFPLISRFFDSGIEKVYASDEQTYDSSNLGAMIGLLIGSIVGAGAAAFALFKIMRHTLGELALFFETRWIWYVFALSCAAIITGLMGDIVKKVEERENYLNAIMEMLKNVTTSSLLSNELTANSVDQDLFNKKAEMNNLARLSNGPVCLNQVGGRFVVDRECACKKKPNGCKAYSGLVPSESGFSQYPSIVQKTMKSALDAIKGIENGNVVQANAAANAINANRAALNKFKDDTMKKLTDDAIKNGLPVLTQQKMDDEVNKYRNGFKKQMMNQLKNNSKALSEIENAVGLGGAQLDETLNVPEDQKKLLDQKSKDPAGKGAIPSGGEEIPASEEGLDDLFGGMDNKDKEAVDPFATSKTDDAAAADREDFAGEVGDVNKNSQEDIFKLLSRRYIITAFPRFLQEE